MVMSPNILEVMSMASISQDYWGVIKKTGGLWDGSLPAGSGGRSPSQAEAFL